MITLSLTEQPFWKNDVAGYIFLMDEDLQTSHASNLDYIEQHFYPGVKSILKHHSFEGKKGQSYYLTAFKDDRLVHFIFVGQGQGSGKFHEELEVLRRGLGTAADYLSKRSIASAIVATPNEKLYDISRDELIKQVATVIHLADYHFVDFKSGKEEKTEKTCNLLLAVQAGEQQRYQEALEQGIIIGKATNDARRWADLPANILTPTRLSEEAKKIADRYNMPCTIFGRDRAEELGMGAFLAVESGSEQPGKFVVIEHKAQDANAQTIVLVGKGITFDTGGISLKPSHAMAGMKFDMCGAAAVIATMSIIGQLKPNVNVVGITPLTENMPSGKASRQDDIVCAMNGKFIEIRNTDAEGRLVLADALCYAEKFYQPDIIIDIATLTGACLYALGYFYAGLMTQDDDLIAVLPKLGYLTGDRVWPLPLDDDYKPANKSRIADIANTGSVTYKAGTIIGGCFLSAFVEKARWAHIDIAGTADAVPAINYLGHGKGATGAGVRLLTEFVLQNQKTSSQK